jgi:multidrug transporter EmrE-like cation transporter
MQTRRLLPLLAVLAFVAYLPVLSFPFISDNYTEIPLSIGYGTWHGLSALFANPVFHFRLSYIFANAWIAKLFGFTPHSFYIASIVFHILCVCVVWGTGAWRKIGWKASTWAAGFFAVYEGHQEAVMWLAGWTEMFLVLFGGGCFVCWVLWLQGGRRWLYAIACILFIAALFSKESSYMFAPLLLLPITAEPNLRRRGIRGIIPFLAGTAVYVGFIALGLRTNPRSQDGTFVLSANMPWHLLNSLSHMLFVWGLLALAFLLILRARDTWRMAAISLGWMAIALVPYSFLTYMNRVPSRQTYVASIGLAWLVGIALTKLEERFSVRPTIAVACVIAGVNIGILWTKKRRQYLERAQPTELLIQAVHKAHGDIRLSCFPYSPLIAGGAVEYAHGQLVLDGPSAQIDKPHCLSFSYKDAFGDVHQTTVHTAI